MNLEKSRLGKSELEITRVGIGTAPIGSTPDWSIYWGQQSESDSICAIEVALELGVNWIDTAPFYGWGRAEEIVGKALRGKRDRAFIFTKCGTLRDEKGGWQENLSPASIRQEVERSLRNLRTDYIDLYQFHDPDPNTPIEESWATMQMLIQEGKVRFGGLSNHPVELIQRAMTIASVASVQHQYNLLHRNVEQDILPFAKQHSIGFLSWSPLASGFLTDGFDLEQLEPNDFRRRHPYSQGSTLAKLTQTREALQQIARNHGRKLVELAVAWVLREPTMTGAILGIRNELDARTMADGMNWRLTEQESQDIEQALGSWL